VDVGGRYEPFPTQDIEVVAYGDRGQTQFFAQGVDRCLATFLQDIQDALTGYLHGLLLSISGKRANSSTGSAICQIAIIII
jgi:hypothetical protein